MSVTTVRRICPLCEATCGLELTVEGRKVTKIRGDKDDFFSEGYLCPKGVALKDLDADPDVLKTPMIREGDAWREASWDEAFELIDRRLKPIVKEHGKHAVGVYLGNPAAHKTSVGMYLPVLAKALGTRNVYSASTVDQFPKMLASGLMFGTALGIPIPDIDRTDYMIILGANPLVSNGSLMTAPNYGARLRGVRERGGKVVVIDPRRTKTATAADEHLFIRPGSDAYFLFAIVHTLFEEGLVKPGRLAEYTNGLEEIEALAKEYAPEAVEERCGVPAADIRRLTREFAAAPSACLYARIGTCTQEFGTIASWLPDVIHVLTGNLDRPGGAMFTKPAHGPANTKGTPGKGRGIRVGRHRSRVRGAGEIYGELPAACLAEEIETPGEGQIRAMFTVAGNPVLSTPNGARLGQALDSLEFMVSVDIYLNETTRHADVILPGPSFLEDIQFDAAFAQLSVRNVVRFSPAVFPLREGAMTEWEILLRLASIASGGGPKPDLKMVDDMVLGQLIQREMKNEGSPIAGRNAAEIMKALEPRRGPERMIDFLLRTGPYGEGFGKDPNGLTLDKVIEAQPKGGIDLGPMAPRIPEVLRTPSGKIELTPPVILEDVPRLREAFGRNGNGGFVLIGRRHLFTNNSWMHNLEPLGAGKAQCTLLMNPDDVERLGLSAGAMAEVASRTGRVQAPVEIDPDIMPGVVSLPHGWGHSAPGSRLKVASRSPGVNSNLLADEMELDAPSGNAVLCGIPVSVTASLGSSMEATGAAAAAN
jgi:anaerobic selenocysteine-containing dehydrogenase